MKKSMPWKIGLVVLAVAGLGIGASTVMQQSLFPMITEEINKKINGTLSVSAITLDWDGTLHLQNPLIVDTQGKRLVEGQEVEVALGPWQSVQALISGKPLEAISTITVKQPMLYAEEYKDGQWNIASLVKENEQETSMDLRALLRIEDGRSHIRLHDGQTIEVAEMNGRISLANYPEVQGNVQMKVNGSPFTLHGTYENEKNYRAVISADALSLSYATRFLTVEGLTLEGGMATQIRGYIQNDNGKVTMKGKAHVEELTGRYEEYAFAKGTAIVSWDEHGAAIDKGKLEINEQPVEVDGTVSFDDTPQVQLLVHANKVELQPLLPHIGLVGLGSAKITIEGALENPNVIGTIEGDNLQYEQYHIDHIQSGIEWRNKKLSCIDGRFTMGNGHGTFNGEYEGETGNWIGTMALYQIAVGPLSNLPVEGTVSAYVRGTGTKEQIHQVDADVEGTSLSYQGIYLDQGQGHIQYRNSEIEVPWLQGTIGSGAVNGYGRIGKEGTNFRLAGTDVPLDAFSTISHTEMSGNMSFVATIEGKDTYHASVDLSATNGMVHGLAYDEIQGHVRWDTNTLYVDALQWNYKEEEHKIAGNIQWQEDPILHLTVNSHKGRVEKVLSSLGYGHIPFTGWFNNHMDISGTVSNPKVTGRAGLWEGSISSYLYDTIFIRYDWDKSGLRIEDLRAHAMDSTILASGTVGDTLDVAVTSPDLNLQRFTRSLPFNADGKLQISGTITGTPQAPEFRGNMYGSMLNINGSSISNVEGQVYYLHDVLNFTNVQFYQGGGTYFFHGGMNLKTQQLFGNGKISNGDLHQLALMASPNLQALEGKIEGSLDIGGTVQNPAFYVRGTITDGLLGDIPIHPSVIDMGMENHVFTVKDLSLHLGDGLLYVQGKLDLYGDMNIQAEGKKVDVRLWNALAGTQENITGNMDFTFTGKGPSNNPTVQWKGDIKNASYNGVYLDMLSAEGTIENRTIRLKEFLASKGPYQLTAYGKVPLAVFWNRERNYRNEAMDLRLNFDKANLEVLPMLTPWVTSASGPMKGELALSGTFNNPVVKGNVSVEKGRIWIKDTEVPIEIEGQITATGQEASFKTDGNIGKGTFHGEGNIGWNGLSITSYSGHVQANDLELTHPYYRGTVSGDFLIEPGRRNPVLKGTLDMENALISIPTSFELGESSGTLGLDIAVRANKNVRLYNPLLYDVTIGGMAQFKGTTAYPIPSGKFTVQKGSVRYLNTKFYIQSGEASFNQIGSFLPSISLEAEARKNPYKIEMNVKGPVDHMDLQLTSTPPLTEQQIISLLTLQTTGKDTNGKGDNEVNGLISAGLEMTFAGGFEALAGKYLGLDYINVSTGSLDPYEKTTVANESYYNIEMGKYIFDNFLLTAAFGVNNDQNSIGFRYNVSDTMVLNGWKNSEDNFYIGAEYTYTFW